MKYDIRIGTQQFAVQIQDLAADRARVTVDGAPFEVRFSRQDANVTPPISTSPPPAVSSDPSPPRAAAPRPAAAGGTLLAPLPGIILEIRVKPGDAVGAGQIVAVMEAMKMENNLTVEKAGTVREIRVQKGSEVATGDVIMVLEG